MPDFLEAKIKFCAGHVENLSAKGKALIGFAFRLRLKDSKYDLERSYFETKTIQWWQNAASVLPPLDC